MTLQEYKDKVSEINKKHFAHWEMEINCIVPYVAYNKRTKKEGIEHIILVGRNPDGTREFYSWISTQGEYELLKID